MEHTSNNVDINTTDSLAHVQQEFEQHEDPEYERSMKELDNSIDMIKKIRLQVTELRTVYPIVAAMLDIQYAWKYTTRYNAEFNFKDFNSVVNCIKELISIIPTSEPRLVRCAPTDVSIVTNIPHEERGNVCKVLNKIIEHASNVFESYSGQYIQYIYFVDHETTPVIININFKALPLTEDDKARGKPHYC